jgi:hypothetical protein
MVRTDRAPSVPALWPNADVLSDVIVPRGQAGWVTCEWTKNRWPNLVY